MDDILSEFIAKTSCDPGFAQDLLNHHSWDLGHTLKSYYQMKDIISDKEDTSLFCNNKFIKPPSESLTNADSVTLIKEVSQVSNKYSSEPSLSSQSSDICDSSINSSPSKLAFNFTPIDGLFPDKKLSRGISRADNNVNLVLKARSEFAQDFQTSSRGSRLLNVDGFLETHDFTFTLPNIFIHQEEFSEFLRKDLIEKSTLASLESAKRLNWWSDVCQTLYPLVTSGDGNCLLHAASLGMWGFHDRELTLRRALHILLSNSSYTPSFYRRWRWQTHFQNLKAGLALSESEWEYEWDNVLRMASTEPRSKNFHSSFEINGGKKEPNEYEEKSHIYESLEEVHIFVLAHVLRRPIIVIADTMLKDLKGEAFFPIPFGGLYLPFECPDSCLMKSPLCLTYDAAHFSALVAMNKDIDTNNLPLAIPLMDVDHNILPLHFAIDPGEELFLQTNVPPENLFNNLTKKFTLTEQDKIELLKKYFDIVTLTHLKSNCVERDLCTISNVVEKSQTLPINFGRKSSEYSDVQLNSENAKTLSRKVSAKQIFQRPFVSFGRMSKRIKKNIGHLARRSASFRLTKSTNMVVSNSVTNNVNNTQNSENYIINNNDNILSNAAIKLDFKESIINTDNSIFYCETYVFAANLQKNKHPFYYDDMIKNYLITARARFLHEKREKKLNSMPSSTSSSSTLSSSSSTNNSDESVSNSQIINCVNPGCSSPTSASTNYLCLSCFEEQKRTLIESNFSSKLTKNSPDANGKKASVSLTVDTNIDSSAVKLKDVSIPKLASQENQQLLCPKTGDNQSISDDIAKLKIYNDISYNDQITREYCVPNSL